MLGLGLGLQYGSVLAPTFSPDQISQLKVWLKGDAGVTLVGGEVDVWADQSGNGNNVSAPAAINRPTTSTQKSKTVLVFSGSSGAKNLRNLTTELFRNLDGGTIIVAGKCNDTSASRQQVYISTNTTSTRALIGYRVSNGAKLGAAAAGRRNNADAISAEVGQAVLSTAWLNNAVVFNYQAATLTTYVDGTQTDLLNPFQTTGTTPNDGGSLSIGSNLALSGGWFDGQIGEILVYQKVLNSTELALVNTYLNNRWKP